VWKILSTKKLFAMFATYVDTVLPVSGTCHRYICLLPFLMAYFERCLRKLFQCNIYHNLGIYHDIYPRVFTILICDSMCLYYVFKEVPISNLGGSLVMVSLCVQIERLQINYEWIFDKCMRAETFIRCSERRTSVLPRTDLASAVPAYSLAHLF
jgi:hypothetical protein